MHVQIRNDNGELLGDLHISREMQSAQIMYAEIECLEQLVQIARSQNVPLVTIIAPNDDQSYVQMESLGWRESTDLIVMYKER